MPMNREVFLSLLALDAYNRGYGENVGGLETPTLDADGDPVEDIRLGRAQIISDSEAVLGPNAQAAGFYAIAYDWNGERVISFRGTNFIDHPPALRPRLTTNRAEARYASARH